MTNNEENNDFLGCIEEQRINNGIEQFMEKMFGGMRYLTKEGQNDYNDNLDNLYKDLGVQLFDFL